MNYDEYWHPFYYALRTAARETVAESFIVRMKKQGRQELWNGMTLASITPEALNEARLEWPKYYGPDTHDGFAVSWESIHHNIVSRPAYFDLAIWQKVNGKDVLQGLASGKPSNAKTHLTINWVERSFAPTYFKGGILLPVLACAEEYARLLGCERVLVKDAVDPEKYAQYGYTPYKLKKVRGSYLAKELGHG